jgi:hypothetical protein
MTEQPIIYQTPKIDTETGKNIKEYLSFKRRLQGVELKGFPEAVGQAAIKLGYAPVLPAVDLPGHIDEALEAVQSSDAVDLRTNVVGQQVPSRYYEWADDIQGVISGTFANYGGLIIFPIIGAITGYWSSEEDAEEFIQKVENKHQIKEEWVDDFIRYKISLKHPPNHFPFEARDYKIENGKPVLDRIVEATYSIDWRNGKKPGKPLNVTDVIHYVCD